MRRLHFKRNPVRNSHEKIRQLQAMGNSIAGWIDDIRFVIDSSAHYDPDDDYERREDKKRLSDFYISLYDVEDILRKLRKSER